MVTKTVTVNGSEPLMLSKPLHFDVNSSSKPNKASRVTFSETSDTIELDSLEIEAELNEWSTPFDSVNQNNTLEYQRDRTNDNVTVIETNAESASTTAASTPEPLQPLKPYTTKMAVIKLNGKSNVINNKVNTFIFHVPMQKFNDMHYISKYCNISLF